jgi:hypothetical protein
MTIAVLVASFGVLCVLIRVLRDLTAPLQIHARVIVLVVPARGLPMDVDCGDVVTWDYIVIDGYLLMVGT